MLFYVDNCKYYPIPSKNLVNTLPKGIYQICYEKNKGIYLNKHSTDKFDIPEKIYGEKIRRRIKKLVNLINRTDSSAALLLGSKGSGKTVTVKYVCNYYVDRGYNILLYETPIPADMFKIFLDSLDRDTIIVFDEFEKMINMNRENNSDTLTQIDLLNLLDGTASTNKVHFLLVANNVGYIRDEFLRRPSRVRYVMNYDSIDTQTIKEILEDKLTKKELVDNIVKSVSTIEDLNFDLLLSLIEEINYGYSIDEVLEDFGLGYKNVKLVKIAYGQVTEELHEPLMFTVFGDKLILDIDKIIPMIKDETILRQMEVLSNMMSNKIKFFYPQEVKEFDIKTDVKILERSDMLFYVV